METVSPLKKRKNREGYYVRIYCHKTGRRTWRKVGETRQQALRNRNRLLVELAEGRPQNNSVSVAEALRRFAGVRNRRLAENTKKTEVRHFNAWREHWKKKRVDRITARSVELLFGKLEAKGWAGVSLNRSRTLLKAFFKFCRAHGWVHGEDPARTISLLSPRLSDPPSLGLFGTGSKTLRCRGRGNRPSPWRTLRGTSRATARLRSGW